MAKSFEELDIWQSSRLICGDIYRLTFSSIFSLDYGLKSQIQRATVSVSSNIAEGFERSNNNEFITFLRYAKGSIGEVRCQLYLALDLGYINQDQHDALHSRCLVLSRQISQFIKYLKSEQKDRLLEKSAPL